jgi:hypothetical protein
VQLDGKDIQFEISSPQNELEFTADDETITLLSSIAVFSDSIQPKLVQEMRRKKK